MLHFLKELFVLLIMWRPSRYAVLQMWTNYVVTRNIEVTYLSRSVSRLSIGSYRKAEYIAGHSHWRKDGHVIDTQDRQWMLFVQLRETKWAYIVVFITLRLYGWLGLHCAAKLLLDVASNTRCEHLYISAYRCYFGSFVVKHNSGSNVVLANRAMNG